MSPPPRRQQDPTPALLRPQTKAPDNKVGLAPPQAPGTPLKCLRTKGGGHHNHRDSPEQTPALTPLHPSFPGQVQASPQRHRLLGEWRLREGQGVPRWPRLSWQSGAEAGGHRVPVQAGQTTAGRDGVKSGPPGLPPLSLEMAPWFQNDSLPLLICILRVRSFALCKSLDRNR